MKEVLLAQGPVRYREYGQGEPIVLVHGFLTDGRLWQDVAPLLARDYRVIAPDWPLGSHVAAMNPGADLSAPGVAAIIAGFLEALELENVTLVGNDSGGALCQLVAVKYPDRLGRLVLTPADAYENFPPPPFRPLRTIALAPALVFMLIHSMRPAWARRLPLGYGWVSKRVPEALTASWIEPARHSAQIRRDLAKFMRGAHSGHTIEAARHFGEFQKPVLLAWAPDDRFFKMPDAERLQRDFPDARIELIEDSYTFVAIDQPARTAELIGQFAGRTLPAAV
jgi:pimeloyl-ACP methyl ester carboxylesterase